MKRFRASILVALLLAVSQSETQAQSRPSDTRAFAVEAAGGIIGSAAGAVAGLVISEVDECSVEDLGCTIKGLGVAGIGSAIGATAGTYLAGRSAGSRPSLFGAVLGSAVGVVAGAAVVHGLTEEANLHLDKPMTIAAYSITHGIVAALGSRLFASLR
ncbi:MAG: hypothetical protein ACSLFK_10425 [Gemmatimonadaceae bacterium]